MTAKKKPVPIVDATKPLAVQITRHDIVPAIPGDDNACALAQRMLRQRGVLGVSIGATSALIRRANRIDRYTLSKKDQAIIRAFDDSSIFPTVTVTLEPPKPKQKLGARQGEAHGSNTRSGKGATPRQHLERQASRHLHTP